MSRRPQRTVCLDGELGDGTKTDSATFKQVLTDVEQVAAGGYYTLALKTDGSLWATGYNNAGQLGDGTTTNSSTFKQVLTDVVQVEGGGSHTMALKKDGSLWVTGTNGSGQLGDGTKTASTTFKQVLTGVEQVAAGIYHTMALKTDGSLWSAGRNNYGQLGDSTTTDSTTFKQVLTGVEQVTAGNYHTLVRKTDGTLWSAGRNNYGQLGDSTTTDSSTFKQVLTGVEQVAAGSSHTLAIKTDGSLWATGYNLCGELGDGTTTNKSSFVEVVAAPVLTPLDVATNAAVEAERLQSQAAVDAARALVVALPDGPDKDALSSRLSVVQATIDARVAAEEALSAGTLESISIAMTLVNAMPESAEKAVLIQQLQEAQTEAEANAYPMGTDGGNVTVNAFINPTITLSMDTHVVDFNASDPTVASYEKPAVIGLTVQSNNTYRLIARALDDFKTGGASPLVMAADHLEAKASTSADFLAMSKDADAVLLQNMPNTGGSQHELDFRFDSDWQMKPGAYSTTIKLTASQL